MSDKRVFLKVKLKSLAEEARIIKREENRRKVPRGRLNLHGRALADEKNLAVQTRDESSVRRAARRAKPWYGKNAQELHELHRHRIDVVRLESRLANIAYAWIRGRNMEAVDSYRQLRPQHLDRIAAIVKKYGDPQRPLYVSNRVVSWWCELVEFSIDPKSEPVMAVRPYEPTVKQAA